MKRLIAPLILFASDLHAADSIASSNSAGSTAQASKIASRTERVELVKNTRDCVAFWDFVKRETTGACRFTAHVPSGTDNDFALDAANYVKDFWGEGREATYADFPLLDRGPFGQAIQIRKEEDASFRPLLWIPRARLHNSGLDIKGKEKSVTIVVWAIRESGNHALAGIWHEGTDLKEKSTETIQKAVRGQRQYALFAGLNKPGSACGHVSENGASSFAYKYAMHKSNSMDISPTVPADAPPETLDSSWQTFAMTFDHTRQELTSWLNGKPSKRWESDIRTKIPPVYNAWLQGQLHQIPGIQPGEDPTFPPDQFYNPPENIPLASKVLSETAEEKTELLEYRYTRVKVTHKKNEEGIWTLQARDLAEVLLNPWWFPHSIYSPADDGSGGPFTIGRVIHSSRSVGFTGWIGGVAVFNRALTPSEIASLSQLSTLPPVTAPGL
jgi:hypothetical protein